jgi:hypothetical protein
LFISGDCNVPNYYPPDTALAAWVNHHRRKRIRTKLYPYQVERLNSIGFEWNPKPSVQDNFNKFFPRLVDYKHKMGDCNVPFKYKEDPELGKWVRNVRNRKRKGTISEMEVEALENIQFQWKIRDTSFKIPAKWEKEWQDNYEQLKQFKEEHG